MRRSFDRAAHRWVAMLAILFLGSILASVALNATTLTLNVPARLLVAVTALGCLLLAVAYFRQHVIADDDGLHVRNLFSQFSIQWADIARFEPPPSRSSRQGFGREFGLAIITRDDRRLYVSLWGAGAWNRPGFADGVLAELEQLRLRTQLG